MAFFLLTSQQHFLQSFRAFYAEAAALGAEKKSGVPYILTPHARHRQTPVEEHEEKTRHV